MNIGFFFKNYVIVIALNDPYNLKVEHDERVWSQLIIITLFAQVFSFVIILILKSRVPFR